MYKFGPFPSFPTPLFQSESKCEFIDMKTYFYSHVNKTHFHKKGFVFSLVLKVESFGTQKWPVERQYVQISQYLSSGMCHSVCKLN